MHEFVLVFYVPTMTRSLSVFFNFNFNRFTRLNPLGRHLDKVLVNSARVKIRSRIHRCFNNIKYQNQTYIMFSFTFLIIIFGQKLIIPGLLRLK